MGRSPSLAIAALALVLAAAPARAAEDGKDIRDIAIGMKVAELPQVGYVELLCAKAPDKQLDSWEGFAQCPANDKGQREVRFQFDESDDPRAKYNDRSRGTKIGGHPVLISLLISKAETVDGILIETDPKVRLFMKKKAFLMGEQIRQRYGEDGWTCADRPKAADEEPIGGEFIKERCEKMTQTRRYVYERDLFQSAGQALKDFVSTTRLAILPKD
jgi:hypothetical protein